MSTERRLFFALWPDDAIRAEIVDRAGPVRALGRHRVPDHNLHLTLVFLGQVPADRVPALLDDAGRIGMHRFTLRLDRYGLFQSARVAWLGAERVPAGEALVDALQGVAVGQGITVDERSWCPHVTLLRRVHALPSLPAPRPVDWPVRDFALVESIPGAPYQVLRSWPLE